MAINKYFFLLYLLIFSAGLLEAQTISGKVLDFNSGSPLAGVAIIDDLGNGVSSNAEGDFSFKSKSGSRVLTFRYLGYETKMLEISLNGELPPLRIALSPKQILLGPVVISAGRYEQKIEDVSVSMAVMKPAEMIANNSIDFDDAIDRMAGVNILKGQVNIRGSSGFSYGTDSRVMLLLDDMPLLSADASDVKWNYLPMENIAQTEVIKGAASALFGSSALGGVINLRTGYATESPKTRISLFGQIYGPPAREHADVFADNRPVASGLSAFHSQRFGRLDVSLGINALYQERHRKEEFAKRFRTSLNTRYRTKIEGLTIGVNWNYMVDSTGIFLFWENDSLALVPDTGTNTKQLSWRYHFDPYLNFVRKDGSSHKLRTRYYHNAFVGNTTRSAATMIYGEYLYNKKWKLRDNYELSLSTGLAQRSSIVNGDTLYGRREGTNTAIFAQTEHSIYKLKLSLGIRAERIKLDTSPDTIVPVFRGGLNYPIGRGGFLRASFGQGFRMPSVAERYARTQAGALVILPNPEVMGERSWSSEIGFRQLIDFPRLKGFTDLALFNTRYFDMIEYTFGIYIGEGLGFRAQNITDANIYGLELSTGFQYELRNGVFQIGGGYTLIEPLDDLYDPATADDPIEKYLKYRFKHLLRADIQYQNEHWTIGTNLRYNSFMLRIDESFNVFIDGVSDYRESHNNGDLIVDARLSRRLGERIEIGLICRNVFNRSYTQIVANLGEPRNGVVRLNYRLE